MGDVILSRSESRRSLFRMVLLFRLQNVSLGYNISVNSKFIQNARVSVSGQNLFVITKYKGFDPEVNNGGQSNLNRGDDYDAYPRARTFTFGVNLGF